MKVVIALSGGMDSATALAYALHLGHDPFTVGFTYGSKHNKYENLAARNIASHYTVPFTLVNFEEPFKQFTSALMKSGGEIPEGHYEAKSMEQTVVPGRNIIFTAYLAGLAWSVGSSEVWLGIHAGDHAIYPDCRPGFYSAMNQAVLKGTADRVHLIAPFLSIDKAAILGIGTKDVGRFNVPYQKTRTCYKDQDTACGKCGSCQERLAAFAKNGLWDPLPYESRLILPK